MNFTSGVEPLATERVIHLPKSAVPFWLLEEGLLLGELPLLESSEALWRWTRWSLIWSTPRFLWPTCTGLRPCSRERLYQSRVDAPCLQVLVLRRIAVYIGGLDRDRIDCGIVRLKLTDFRLVRNANLCSSACAQAIVDRSQEALKWPLIF